MFMARNTSPRNTPPPVQPLDEGHQPKSPVLMLPSAYDSPPNECLALTWPIAKRKEPAMSPGREVVSKSANQQVSKSPDASVYHHSRAIVFDSSSGQRTVCLQKTLYYTEQLETPNESPASGRSPNATNQVSYISTSGGSPSPSENRSLVGSKSRGAGSRKEQEASSGYKTSPPLMRNLDSWSSSPHDKSSGSSSPENPTDGAIQESLDSQIRLRSQPKSRKDLQLPRDNKPGRNLSKSDRYSGILEQDHPEETLSRGLFGSSCCWIVPVAVLALLMMTFLIWCFGSPLGIFVPLFGAADECQKMNISHIKGELQRGLIGQPAALNLILDTLGSSGGPGSSNKPLIMFFHGSSGVGKTHTANIIMESVLKNSERDSCIHIIRSDLFLRSETSQSKQVYMEILQEWANGSKKNDDSCCVSFFIFDEVRDDTPQDLTQTLGQVLSQLNSQDPSAQTEQFQIFIIMTAVGAQSISDFLGANMKRGHDRQTLTTLSSNWQEPWKHLVASLDKQDTFWTWIPQGDLIRIPFLPLERSHVKQCAKHSLARKNLTATEERLEWVADQLTYLPEEWPIFSASGCKKVSSKVDLLYIESPAAPIEFKKPF